MAIVLPFERVTETYYTPSQDRLYADAPVYVQLGTPTPAGPAQQNTWHRVDLRPWGVPNDARFAFLNGLLVITHGTSPQIADLRVTFRSPDDITADPTRYIGQCIEAHIGGGQRTNMSAIVKLLNGQFDFAYAASGPIGWPDFASYAINLSLDGYAK